MTGEPDLWTTFDGGPATDNYRRAAFDHRLKRGSIVPSAPGEQDLSADSPSELPSGGDRASGYLDDYTTP